ncbi:hypothetical protein [Nonlabens sp. SY33080]|uniref:hypothetical protein n=1 Tax=Nonlabens sp. SY33080 TaxID=2719911 RepID=UPI001428A670|nr:hypothetical protein [Nonlabens sp. SY33080]
MNLSKVFEYYYQIEKLKQAYNNARSIKDKWLIYGEYYKISKSKRTEYFSQNRLAFYGKYPFNWYSSFSYLEKRTWEDISYINVPLYPQYPVKNFFIDFANPDLKIGLEVDGSNYHDIERDFKIDTKLAKFDWKIYRSPYSESKREYMDIIDLEKNEITGSEKQEAIEHWIMKTTNGLIHAIKYWYFLNQEQKLHNYRFQLHPDIFQHTVDFHQLARRSLIEHRLATFDIGKPYIK